jgi:hypothetical protein
MDGSTVAESDTSTVLETALRNATNAEAEDSAVAESEKLESKRTPAPAVAKGVAAKGENPNTKRTFRQHSS